MSEVRKPSNTEEEYFAREEAEKLHRLHTERLKAMDEQAKEEQKKLHWMKCPKCGYDLETIEWRDVEIERCYHCHAVVLDDGELEKLTGTDNPESLLKSFYDFFRAK